MAAFFGRAALRKMHGQEREKNPELFTPEANPRHFVWPTDAEALAVAKAAMKAAK